MIVNERNRERGMSVMDKDILDFLHDEILIVDEKSRGVGYVSEWNIKE